MENDQQALPPRPADGMNSPLGTTVMNTRVLKEPRGFMRCLQCLFAVVAFASCSNYSSYMEYQVTCKANVTAPTTVVRHVFSYPFRLDHGQGVNVSCGNDSVLMYPPGDLKSDAEFFVFTGVVSFLGTLASLVIYVFYSGLYLGDQKKGPLFDFCFTVIIAVFWLSASAAWANGVGTLKYVAQPRNWIFTLKNSICKKSGDTFEHSSVKDCIVTFAGKFGGANASVILGFLNFFLWATNLWFIYKETSWFVNRSQSVPPQQLTA